MNDPPRRSGEPMLGGRAHYLAANWPRVGIIVTNPNVTLWAVGSSDIWPEHTFVTRHEVSLNGRHLGLGR